MILSTTRALKGKVITGDEHFRGLEETTFIKNKRDSRVSGKN